MIVLITFAFLAGIVTIFAPCILPVLPIVLGAGVTGGRQRPLGIVAGLVVSFTFFTLALSWLTQRFGLSPDTLRTVAIAIIFLFGLLLLFPRALTWFEARVSRALPQVNTNSKRTDFWGGVLVGLSLGLIWTPCVGPIIASVITLSATSGVTAGSVLITAAYAIGTGLPLLAIIYGGQGIIQKINKAKKHTGTVQSVFGMVMVLTAVAMFFGLDRELNARLLDALPDTIYSGLTQQLEETDFVQERIQSFSESQ